MSSPLGHQVKFVKPLDQTGNQKSNYKPSRKQYKAYQKVLVTKAFTVKRDSRKTKDSPHLEKK